MMVSMQDGQHAVWPAKRMVNMIFVHHAGMGRRKYDVFMKERNYDITLVQPCYPGL